MVTIANHQEEVAMMSELKKRNEAIIEGARLKANIDMLIQRIDKNFRVKVDALQERVKARN